MIPSAIKRLTKRLASRMGITVYKTSCLPRCVDLATDLQRCDIDVNPGVIFDVGANEGQMATYFRRAYPKSRIYCFEPFPNAFHACSESFAGDRDAVCLNLALSDQVQDGQLFLSPDSQLNSLKSSVTLGHLGSIPVKVDTIDNVCKRLSIPQIDLLKVDTEGHDLEVLLGGAQTMASGRVGLVLAECGFDPADKRHTHFFELHRLLENMNFHFFGLYNVRQTNQRLYFCDCMFVSGTYRFSR